MNAGIILFLIFAVCVLIGVPISMSLGIGSLAAVALGNLGVSPAVIAQRVFGGLQSTSIMAIAFFILAGNLMPGRRHLPSYRQLCKLPHRQHPRRHERGSGHRLCLLRCSVRFRSRNRRRYRLHAVR